MIRIVFNIRDKPMCSLFHMDIREKEKKHQNTVRQRPPGRRWGPQRMNPENLQASVNSGRLVIENILMG